eukprot:UN02809
MRFSVYKPNATTVDNKAPVLFWLSGLTCTDENFAQKATVAFSAACKHNIVIVLPDTSPRGAGCPLDKESWDFGEGAGFYINATNPDYAQNYNMYDYVTIELYDTIKTLLGEAVNDKRSVMGHSMGGFGALSLYLKGGFESCSAFAPITNPINCPWGQKAFGRYFGEDCKDTTWVANDPCHLVKVDGKFDKNVPILIDQGMKDNFLIQKQLLPENFLAAAKEAGVAVEYNERQEFDHSYFFINTFIVNHIEHHAKILNNKA